MKSPQSQSITANGQSIVFDVRNLNTIKFAPKGTFAGVNVAFEASLDYGQTWVTVQAVRSNSTTVEAASGVLSAAPAYNYRAEMSGYTDFRIRSTAFTSGTQVWTLTGSVAQTDPIQPTLGTVVLGGGSASVGTVATPTGTPFIIVSAASTNLSNQVAAATSLFELTISNPTATPATVKLYNKSTAPVVATDVPVFSRTIAAGDTQSFPFGNIGKRFSAGLSVAITGAAADTDATNAPVGVKVHGTRI